MDKETVVVPIRKSLNIEPEIPANFVRSYIADMLGELCHVAKNAGQNDLHELLNITHKAVELSNNRRG